MRSRIVLSAATRLRRYGNLEDWMMVTKKELLDVAERSIALNKEQQDQLKQLYADNDKLIAQNKQLVAEVERLKLSKLDQENLRTGRMIGLAARELHAGYEIRINIEKESGAVTLITPEGDERYFNDMVDGMSHCIEAAIKYAGDIRPIQSDADGGRDW